VSLAIACDYVKDTFGLGFSLPRLRFKGGRPADPIDTVRSRQSSPVAYLRYATQEQINAVWGQLPYYWHYFRPWGKTAYWGPMFCGQTLRRVLVFVGIENIERHMNCQYPFWPTDRRIPPPWVPGQPFGRHHDRPAAQ
jgi:hypothetical protein